MGLLKFVREVKAASHYRSRPMAMLQYAYAKWVFSRFRQNDPWRVLETIGIDVAAAMVGFDFWRPILEKAVRSVQQENGRQGGISFEDGLILYGMARALRPMIVIETGVAAGVSTSFLGAALIENGSGRLFSIELPCSETSAFLLPDGSRYSWQVHGVGWAVPTEIAHALAPRHHLILKDVRLALPELLNTIPSVDIFFHDDLHTPDHMFWQYDLVWPKVSPGGVLVSDDVNHGWIKFCKKTTRSRIPLENVDRLGAIRKPMAPEAVRT
jgi:predicted O-methyltransferase YrrM